MHEGIIDTGLLVSLCGIEGVLKAGHSSYDFICHMCILVTPRAAIVVHGCSVRTGYALPLLSVALDLRPDSPHHEFLVPWLPGGRRQHSLSGTSRMTRECHVRICEKLGVQLPGSTRQKVTLPDSRTMAKAFAFTAANSIHSITSSARASSEAGIVRPNDLAAFMLMISSNFVGSSTGRSDGLAPFRILST